MDILSGLAPFIPFCVIMGAEVDNYQYLVSDDDIDRGVLDLHRRNIRHIQFQTTLTDVEEICLDYNDIEDIPDEVAIFTAAKHLSAVGNRLKSLPSTMSKLLCLETLNLDENEFSSIPNCTSMLKSLKTLSMIGNNISVINDEISSHLLHLTELYMNENSIKVLPKSIGKLKCLRALEANENNIRALPHDIGCLESLEILSFVGNDIVSLPYSFKDLKSLKYLCLSKNKIKELPETLAASLSLEKIYMDNNQIQVLPAWFSDLPNLQVLQLNNNRLIKRALSSGFCNTSVKLKSLKVGANFMTELPNNFGNLSKLCNLHLGSTMCELEVRHFQNGNWLLSLPNSFSDLVMLTKCHLDENQLHELPSSFGKLVNLSWLDLGQNMLKALPDSFCDLKSLGYVQLSKNKLVTLPENFGKLSTLFELRLDFNYLTELPATFSSLVNLTSLDLFNNRLTEIPKQLSSLKKLVRLDLDQNPFKLDLTDIPHLIPTNNYAKRNPDLMSNWRGKLRADKIQVESIELPPVSRSEMNGNDINNSSKIAGIERNTLDAMRKGSTLWQSHNGSYVRYKQRTVKNGVLQLLSSKTVEISESDDEFEPIIYQTSDRSKRKQNCHIETQFCLNFESEEDWDAECVDVGSGNYQNMNIYTDVIDLSVNKYPSAPQTKSITANYDSLSRYPVKTSSWEVQPSLYWTIEVGQFDDAP